MNEKILACAIEMIRKDGLKFNLDELCKALKISKKTIYKHYRNKEEFSINIYKYYFYQVNCKIDEITIKTEEDILSLLNIYEDALIMTAEEIFNKFQINNIIRQEVKELDENILLKIVTKVDIEEKNHKVVACIIKGSLKEALLNTKILDETKKELVRLLWK